MNKITQNPYRIAGVLAGATAREIQRQKAKATKFASVGKTITTDYDFPFLPTVKRTPKLLNTAYTQIQQNKDKVNNALFWFAIGNSFDKTAIDYLKKGDKEKALEIWQKVTQNRTLSANNITALNNLSTLSLLSNSMQELQEAITAKIKLINSDAFNAFVHAVADETYSIEKEKQIAFFIDNLLEDLKAKFSSNNIIKLFNICDESAQSYLTKKFTATPIHKIETHIENTKQQRKATKKEAYTFGIKLYDDCVGEINNLKKLLGANNLKYKLLADNLAKEIMQCGIDYFKENEDLDDVIEKSLTLLDYAKSVAVVDSQTIERIADNKKSLEEIKEREINHAISVLKSIENAYKKACNNIDNQVDKLRYNGTGPLRFPRVDVNINWDKVNEMKRNALDWKNVVVFIKDNIGIDDLIKIEHCSDQIKIAEYKRLVNFILAKMGPIEINKIKYLCYWGNVKGKQIKSTLNEVKSGASNTFTKVDTATDGCLTKIFRLLLGMLIWGVIIGLLSLIFDL